MQDTSLRFEQLAKGYVRPISWQLRMSFDKTFEDSIGFFILDSSLLDGTDVLSFNSDDPVQLWDKYMYEDFSDRTVQLEWQCEEEVPYSVALAMADMEVNNYDGLFTAGGDSPLEPDILPKRPVRILAGFGGENVPQFVGLTQSSPEANYRDKTASFHAVDFLSSLFEKPLDETVMLENVRTDEAIDYLLQLFGLLPEQYFLEEGSNTIGFVYFEKGKKLGEAIRSLVQAELGSFYMDETGTIRFKNSKRAAADPVYTFDKSNIQDFKASNDDNIINVVEINANVREVQAEQLVYTLSITQALEAGDTEIFLNLNDPITSLNSSISFAANSLEDGSGSDQTGNVTITDIDQFATAVKLTFNNSGSKAYLTSLQLNGTPAKAVGNPLYVRYSDQDSIDKYDEQVMTINNDFIQNKDQADSVGLTILYNYAPHNNTIELTVKGNPALQVRDVIHVEIDDIDQDYTISKVYNTIQRGKYTQRLIARVYNVPPYFILSSDSDFRSLLDGTDFLAP
jgi:hypothetical protein